MPGQDVLFLRIEPTLKERLKEAARTRGESVTTFVLKAVEKAAKEVEMKAATVQRQSKAIFRGVPTFFRAMCSEAAQGGTNGYFFAGMRLFTFAKEEVEDDDEKLDELERLLNLNSVSAAQSVLEWFERELPRCMELVPRRRRAQFLKGVYEQFAEEGMER